MKLDGMMNSSELQRTEMMEREISGSADLDKAMDYLGDVLDVREVALEYITPSISQISFGSTCTA